MSFGIYFYKEGKYNFKTPEDLRYIDYNNSYYWGILCFAIVYAHKNILDITWISTNPLYQNKGFATLLIQKIIKIGKRKKYKYITLDDCCDSHPPKNIYFKLGFQIKSDSHVWVPWDVNNLNTSEERRLRI